MWNADTIFEEFKAGFAHNHPPNHIQQSKSSQWLIKQITLKKANIECNYQRYKITRGKRCGNTYEISKNNG